MQVCVSETSYYLVFVVAIVSSVLLIGGSAYSYDRFRNMREKPDDVTTDNLHRSANVNIAFMILGLIGVVGAFVLFFGFQKRMVGLKASIKA